MNVSIQRTNQMFLIIKYASQHIDHNRFGTYRSMNMSLGEGNVLYTHDESVCLTRVRSKRERISRTKRTRRQTLSSSMYSYINAHCKVTKLGSTEGPQIIHPQIFSIHQFQLKRERRVSVTSRRTPYSLTIFCGFSYESETTATLNTSGEALNRTIQFENEEDVRIVLNSTSNRGRTFRSYTQIVLRSDDTQIRDSSDKSTSCSLDVRVM